MPKPCSVFSPPVKPFDVSHPTKPTPTLWYRPSSYILIWLFLQSEYWVVKHIHVDHIEHCAHYSFIFVFKRNVNNASFEQCTWKCMCVMCVMFLYLTLHDIRRFVIKCECIKFKCIIPYINFVHVKCCWLYV